MRMRSGAMDDTSSSTGSGGPARERVGGWVGWVGWLGGRVEHHMPAEELIISRPPVSGGLTD